MTTGRGADLAGQADFAKRNEAFGQCFAAQAGSDGQHDGQVGCGLADAHTAHCIDKHVLVHAGDARVAVQHGQQHGQAVALQAHAQAPRAGAAVVHQGLDFHQHGARAFERDHDAAAGYRLAVLAQEDGAGVGDALEAFFGHGEHANFVDGAKAVFDGADQTKAAVRVALKVEHGVNHVFEHARAGQRTFLGDVADQHDGGAAGLGGAGQVRGAFAHLRHRAGCTGQLIGIDRLNGIDDGYFGLASMQGSQDFFELDFGEHRYL